MKKVLHGLTGVVLCGVMVSIVIPIKWNAEQLRSENLNGPYATRSTLIEHADGVHAARVDTPSVMDMTHASPDTWGTLPPPVDLLSEARPYRPMAGPIALTQ